MMLSNAMTVTLRMETDAQTFVLLNHALKFFGKLHAQLMDALG
jgi:hypothetical protein